MTRSEIRGEISEMINAGTLNVPKIVKYFNQHRPDADIEKVKEEAKELVAETRLIIKRGY